MIFFILLCSLFSLVFTLPVLLPVQRDVWVPLITYPTNTSVWVAGGTYNVTWDTSDEPSEVTNPNGMVYLRRGNATQDSPLAQDFPLTAGVVNITIPANTQADTEWIVVLFGDSGNWSPPFKIVATSS